ncbi:MAG: hypothetical protein IJ242_10650, partial [Clostridia bacterium]|nr:hypothetical protein [Clostridia bacterium]
MAQWKKNVLEIPELYLLGRTLQTESGIQIFWPLSGIRFSYTGTHLSCEIECTYHQFPIYVAVLIDKMPVMRFPLRRGHAVYPILNGMDRKRHEIEIVRETQPVFDDPDSTFIIQSLSGSGTIFMPRRSEIHLEFIGDSITCGEGTVGAPGNQDWNTLYLSPICGYMQMLTTELQADCHVIA